MQDPTRLCPLSDRTLNPGNEPAASQRAGAEPPRTVFGASCVSPSAACVLLTALTLVAAVLRFGMLDRQSFWSDEAVTVLLTRMNLRDIVSTVSNTESTPPVYYLLAWIWTKVFGDGEVGLRSLSALAGVATVPVTYLAGATLLGRRAGLAAAGLVAVNPTLVWYSQEARAYALAVLLCGISFAACARALRNPTNGVLAIWALASVLAVGTHYFALFVVGAEAAWLLVRRREAAVRRAVAASAVGAAALVPLALEQRGNGFAEFIGASGGLAERIVVVPKQLLVGQALPADRVVAAVIGAVVAASVTLVVARGTSAQRRAVLVAATVGVSAIVAPIALALVGLDYLNTRNALVGAVPLSVAAGAGLAVAAPRRAGTVALVGLLGLLSAVTVVVATDASYHRPDWRGLTSGLGPPDVPRAVVVAPDHQGWFARVPLQLYLPDARAVDRGLVSTPAQFADISRRASDRASPRRLVVRELVLAAVGWDVPSLPQSLLRDFDLVEERTEPGYRFRRYRSSRPHALPTGALAVPLAAVLLEAPSRT
jgi:mannosyltransferase